MGVETTNSVAGIVRRPLIVPLRIAMYSSEPLHHFVDDYLQYLQEVHPTIAALDGVHAHDDLLEDLGRAAIEADTRALSGFARRLNDIRQDGLTPVERIEHPIVAAHIKARMFEAEEIRTWERNPQLYADILASSLAAQALFAYAPITERARRVLSKLRQTGRLIQAARDNVKDPPGIFVKVGDRDVEGHAHASSSATSRGRSAPSMTSTCSATWPMPPPKPPRRFRATSTTWNGSRRPRRADRSGSDARSSSRS